MNKNWIHKAKIYVIITVMLLSFYLPLLPNSLFTPTAHAAGITPDESTVDTTTLLSVSPTLAGENKWYYNGLTAITDGSTGATLGSVYRYISENGEKRNMVKGTDGTKWANALAEDANFVFNNFEKSAQKYLFTPPASTNKSAFDRYLISDLLDAAGITYQSTGSEIRITKPVAPKISTFKVKESPNISGKYPLYSDITIQFTIEEYLEKYDTLRNVQVYGKYEGQPNAFKIGEVPTANTSAGAYTGEFTYTLASNEDLTLYIRAYDAVNQLDQNSKNGETLGSFGKFYKMSGKISTELDVTQDGQPISMYDYTNNTLLESDSLMPSGSMGRQNGKMRQHPNNNIGWFGPVRYPTIWLGNPSDGGTKTAVNTSFQAEGQSEQIKTISAFQKPFMYILGPIDANFAKPDGKVHGSIETSTFTIQKTSQFSSADIEKMFNGNPMYVKEYTPVHSISTAVGKNLGSYYWLRELAEYSGGDVNNTCTAENDTCLNIIQTSYPDISKFELKSTNTYTSANQPISFDFEGFEYVSASRTGATRNKTAWEIEVLSAPSESQVGEKVTGTVFSNKLADNAAKSSMKKYDGKYASTSLAKFTPKADGDYTVRLTVTDEVQRSTKSNLLSFKIGPGGGPGGSSSILIVTPATQTTKVGASVKYEAHILRPNGSQQNVTETATWSTVDEAIAKSKGKGNVEGVTLGTTTVKAEHSGMSGTAIVNVISNPTTAGLTIEPPKQTVKTGDTTRYTAYYTDTNGVKTDVTNHNKSSWSGGGTKATQVEKGKFKGVAVGNETVQVNYNGLTAYAEIEVTQGLQRPIAVINVPEVVEAGQKFCISSSSYDLDGEVTEHMWHSPKMLSKKENWEGWGENNWGECQFFYEEAGKYDLALNVRDNDGLTSYPDEKKITVTAPAPRARFDVHGFFIENRKMWIKFESPYPEDAKGAPIIESKLTITALSGGNQGTVINVDNTDMNKIDYEKIFNVLFRKAGDYEIKYSIKNNGGGQDTEVQTITILEDFKPKANVEVGELYYLPTGSTKVTIKDTSYSDDDLIGYRKWEIARDANNDGIFQANEYVTLPNDTSMLDYNVTKLGNYTVRLTVIETFNEDTHPSAVNLTTNLNVTHRKHDVISKKFHVDNLAPVVSMSAMKKPNVEIIFNTGDVISNDAYTLNKLQDQVNTNLIPSLIKENIEPNIQYQNAEFQDDISGDYFKYTSYGTSKYFWVDYETGLTKEVENPTYSYVVKRGDGLRESTVSGEIDTGARDYEGNVYINIPPRMYLGDHDTSASTYYDWNIGTESRVELYKYNRQADAFSVFANKQFFIDKGAILYHGDKSRLKDIYLLNLTVGANENVYALIRYEMRKPSTESTYGYSYYEYHLFEFDKNGNLLRDGNVRENGDESLAIRYVTDKTAYFIQDSDNFISWELSDIFNGTGTREKRSFVDNHKRRVLMTATEEIMIGEDGGDRADNYVFKKNRNTREESYKLLFSNNSGYKNFDRYEDNVRLTYITFYGWNRLGQVKLSYDYRYSLNGAISWDEVLFKNDNFMWQEPYRTEGLTDVSSYAMISSNQLGYSTDGAIYLVGTDKFPNNYPNVGNGIIKFDEKSMSIVKETPITFDKNYTLTYEDDDDNIRTDQIIAAGLRRMFEYPRNSSTNSIMREPSAIDRLPLRAWNKSLKQQVGKVEWKSAESTKFYVTLTNQEMNDMPADKDFVANMLNQDKVNYITLDTNSTKPLADQLKSAIAEKTMQYTVSSYTDNTVKTAMERISNFVVGVVYPQEDTSINLHVGVDGSSHTLAQVNEQINNIMKPLLNQSGIAINVTSAALANKTINGTTVKKFNVSSPQDYYILVKDNGLTANEITHMSSDTLLGDAYFIGMGKTASKASIETVINKNMHRGQYFDNTNLNASVNQVTEHLIEIVRKRADETVIYGLQSEDEILYKTHYSDYENHPIFKEEKKSTYDKTVFENVATTGTNINALIENPVHVGLYMPTYKAQDDPIKNYTATEKTNFADYRKWSNLADNVKIYVHRLPSAEFTAQVNTSTRALTVVNKASDEDKASINIGYGAGISSQKFMYKNNADNIWKDGLPSTVPVGQTFTIRNIVTDYQFQKTYVDKQVPMNDIYVDFTPAPSVIYKGDSTKLVNHSYKDNDGNLTVTWTYRKKGTTAWTNLVTGAYTNGVANMNWSPITSVFNVIGIYEVKLVATDGTLSGEVIKEVTVLESPNEPPVAKFITDKTTYSDWETVQITNQSTDVDGDSMTAKWQVKLKNSADSTYKQFATGSYNGVTNTALTGWHTTLKQTILDNNMKCSSQTTNCEYTIKLTVSDGTEEDSTTRNITFLKIFEIPNAQEKISGNFHWELQRVANMKHPNLAIQAKPQVDSTHAAIRNIKYGYDIAACTTKEATATTKEVIVPLDCLVSDLSKIKSMKDGKVTFHLEYEYTNHYTQVTGSTEKLPVWETEYVKTFKLADAVGVEKNELTLPFGYPIEKEISLNSFEDLKTGYTVGRDLVIDLTATDRVKQQEYKEYLITNDEHKMKYDLKSQTRLPLWLPSLEYKVSVPSKSQLNNTYNPFIEGFSTGTFTTLDMDENLKDLYKKGQKYELPLQQANITKIGFVPVTNEAKYKFDYLSDLFFVSKHTGYMLRNPLTEIMVKVNEPAYANIKLNQNLINIDTMENMMKLAYQNDYGVPLVDTITTTELKDTQYYYLPVSLTTVYEPKEEYVNEYVLNNVGLNNITLKFNQEFSFDNYMFGDILDEPIFAEQQAPEISIENYPHTVIISDEKLQSLATYINSDNVLIHQFRTGHRELMKKAYDYLK